MQFFAQVEEQVAALPVPESWLCDLLIIDEGQDIPQRSLDVLHRFLRQGGRLVWPDDPEQNLCGHEGAVLENAVELQLDDCFRSPAAIVQALTALLPQSRPLIPANPHYGTEPMFHIVEPEKLPGLLTERINQLCQQGISPKDIALISLHGLQKFALNGIETLGDYRLGHGTPPANHSGGHKPSSHQF